MHVPRQRSDHWQYLRSKWIISKHLDKQKGFLEHYLLNLVQILKKVLPQIFWVWSVFLAQSLLRHSSWIYDCDLFHERTYGYGFFCLKYLMNVHGYELLPFLTIHQYTLLNNHCMKIHRLYYFSLNYPSILLVDKFCSSISFYYYKNFWY